MKINYVTAALALLLMAGCSNDVKESDIKFAGESGAKVSFSAVINNQEASELVTRATETSGSRQVNIEYEYTGGENSLFSAKSGYAENIWVLGTQEYDVTAYYPFTGTSGEEPIAVEVSTNSENQATAAAREQIDFLYAAGKATAETPNVKLAFNHVMSRIKLTFTAGENVTLSDITCYLINLRTKGTFNPNTGETTVTGEPATVDDDIVWTKVGSADNYTIQA
uniref:fimbrillin family protein n=1 Tax=Phocaeicola sp. RTP21198st1_B8_RTP21198_201120 TaxID=3143217 RepID=UPI0034A13E36